MVSLPQFQTLHVSIDRLVATVALSRPAKSNALNDQMWREIPEAFAALHGRQDVQAIVLQGQGPSFCAGIDLASIPALLGGPGDQGCPGRQREHLYCHIRRLQEAFTSIEQCRWPCIAAIHGACVGAGVDLIVACDIRLCSADARFCVKEVDLAITADIGTLQRLPRIVGYGPAAELSLTGRMVGAEEAAQLKLVSQLLPDHAALHAAAQELAASIAAKSPLAVTGTKRVLLHARDHAVQDGLEFVAAYNAATLISADLHEVHGALQKRRKPAFSRL